jgi:O-methyltransferase
MSEQRSLRSRLGEARSLFQFAKRRLWSDDAIDREHSGFSLLDWARKGLCPSYVLTDYGKLWFRDEVFFREYDRLIPDLNHRSTDRKYFLRSLLRLVQDVPGDTAECGVWIGVSSWFICDFFKGTAKTHHGFDSFEGLGAPSGVDGPYWKAGDLASAEDVAHQTLAGFDYRLYKGWIPDRFEEVEALDFSFLHIDVDLHQPTLDSLRFFYPRMASGGIMLFDDYGFITCPGVTHAIDDFFSDKPEPVIHSPTGQGFVIKR